MLTGNRTAASFTAVVATGNRAKIDLLRSEFAAVLAVPVKFQGRDPGEAENRAEVGYLPAVRAKVGAVAAQLPGAIVVAHDSGFEFACLDDAPGPLTARYLSEHGFDVLAARLVPDSDVQVVHAVAIAWNGAVHTFRHADERRVVAEPTAQPGSGSLPVAALTRGPRVALRRCVKDAVAWWQSTRPEAEGSGGRWA
ncbi:non-canonical purine NTP pyrophosphatase [Streptomyces sp. NBC_00079]|uniref:non-canonical purine NTP pyrophosphatase n=1 Tax=Streptomyces sp. NBC_00079 TaxID=2975644 RepID=UPI003251C65A